MHEVRATDVTAIGGDWVLRVLVIMAMVAGVVGAPSLASAEEGCQPGFYGESECVPAPPGTYVAESGAIAATPCPPGTYQPNSGATSCLRADPGTYVDTIGATQATPCAKGTYQPAIGSTSCLLADPGFFVDVIGAIAQSPCPEGFTSDAGAESCHQVVNTTPTADPGGPYLGAVNAEMNFDGTASADPEGDTLNYLWDLGDGATGAGATPSHAYTEAGVYTVCLTVDDGDDPSEQVCTMAVVYDPSAGFVTGGGWIDSPENAFAADVSLSGKASFGFVSKYKKGATTPTGNTEFRFHTAGFAFHSVANEWLVVNQGGSNAQFKGTGAVNGELDGSGNAYHFMIWAGDGSVDTFRIKIWTEDAAGANVVYDNGADQQLGGGSIVVHTAKK